MFHTYVWLATCLLYIMFQVYVYLCIYIAIALLHYVAMYLYIGGSKSVPD